MSLLRSCLILFAITFAQQAMPFSVQPKSEFNQVGILPYLGAGVVGRDRALEIAGFLVPHANRTYLQYGLSKDLEAGMVLADILTLGAGAGRFAGGATRSAYRGIRSGWGRIPRPKIGMAPGGVMVDTMGRPHVSWPKFHLSFSEGGSGSGILKLTKARFGHTFARHGADATDFLINRSRASGLPMGQCLDNQIAGKFIIDHIDKVKSGAISIPVPDGFPARIIMPDGSFVKASKIRLVPGGKGVKTAYPEL